MGGKSATDKENALVQAQKHLQTAIDLLDEAQAPAHIAAHVDLASHQLRDAIASKPILKEAVSEG